MGWFWTTNDDLLQEIRRTNRILSMLVRPRPFTIHKTGEVRIDEMWYQKYDLNLLAVPEAIDAVEQRLAVIVDGVTLLDEGGTFGKEQTIVSFKAPRDSAVRLELAYADQAGNVSQNPLVHEFVAVDKVSPETPAGFGELTSTGEEWVPDAEPTPEPPVED